MGIKKTLSKLGLNENEAALYVAGLAIGPSSASLLSKESGVERVMTYHTLKSLQEKGLLHTTGPAKKTVFNMEPPSRLREIIKQQQEELEQLEKSVSVVEAEIAAIQKEADGHIRVYFYEGIEGLKNVANGMLKSKQKKMRVLAPIKNVMDMMQAQFVKKWLRNVAAEGISSKSIWSVENREPDWKRKGRELRLKPEEMEFPAMVITYDDTTVFMTSPPRPMTIVIENKDVTDTMNAMHEQVWKQSREVQ